MIRTRDIQSVVANHFGLSVEEMLGRDNSRDVARPRQVAMFLALKLTRHKLPGVGRAFNRHHTTVMDARNRIAAVTSQDPAMRKSVRYLTVELARGRY